MSERWELVRAIFELFFMLMSIVMGVVMLIAIIKHDYQSATLFGVLIVIVRQGTSK